MKEPLSHSKGSSPAAEGRPTSSAAWFALVSGLIGWSYFWMVCWRYVNDWNGKSTGWHMPRTEYLFHIAIGVVCAVLVFRALRRSGHPKSRLLPLMLTPAVLHIVVSLLLLKG
ncbi:MAG: hypothetical protein R3F33_03660 [Planctomycetota bacterium]